MRSVGLAARRLAGPIARSERRRTGRDREGAVSRTGVSRAIQFRRDQPGADDPDARRRNAPHPPSQPARRGLRQDVDRAVPGPVRRCRRTSRWRSSVKSRRRRASPFPPQPDPNFNPAAHLDELGAFLSVKTMDGHCMTGVSNSEHGSRVTNLHTHGLHVSPGANAGRGTESDNVFVRLLSRDDWALRQKMGGACTKKPHEYVGHVDYEVIPRPRAARRDARRPVVRRSPIRRGRTGITRTRTARRTTRCRPAWPAS